MADSVASADFYADFSGLTALKKEVKANDPKAIREAARQFESLFTDMMLKSMRAAKLGDGLGDSQETEFYQDMYDQQLALQMSQGKGLGLADMLVQQLTRNGAAKAAAAGSGNPAAAGAAGATGAADAAAAKGAAGSRAATASHAQRIGFIQRVQPYLQRAAAQLGVPASNLIAQAALETGWGQHVPAGSGGSSHNLFGIKAGNGWDGDTVEAATVEYRQGGARSMSQTFRAYSSVQQGVNDYVSLLQGSPAYRQALDTGADVGAFARALQRGGYATDPDYVQKLVSTAASVRALGGDGSVAGAAASSAAMAGAGTGADRGSVPGALKLQARVPTTSSGEPA